MWFRKNLWLLSIRYGVVVTYLTLTQLPGVRFPVSEFFFRSLFFLLIFFLRLDAETTVRGAVYAINDFNGKILAGVNAKVSVPEFFLHYFSTLTAQVQLLKWTEAEDGIRELTTECEHLGHILVLYLHTHGDFILVGDLMKSVTLLAYSPVDSVIKVIVVGLGLVFCSTILNFH
jgi:hypothetical protein